MSDYGIEFRLSAPGATAGNSETQADPNSSLGLYASTTPWSGTLFSDDNLSGTTVYRCVFAANAGSNYSFKAAGVYISSAQPNTSLIALGVDPLFPVLLNSTSPQAAVIAAEGPIAPLGVTFSAPSNGSTAVVVGDLDPMRCRAVWIRRISTGTVAAVNQTFTVQLSGTLTL